MTWKQQKLMEQLQVVEELGDMVVISGGLAWHIMSPPHAEIKIRHDHSDVDLFVKPERSQEVFEKLKEMGFNRYWTKYTTPNFYRYGKTTYHRLARVKILIDLFIGKVPSILVEGYEVVSPAYLIDLYEDTHDRIHSSSRCTAVVNAKKLLLKGIDPVGRYELIGMKKPLYVRNHD